jgi:hypothetical protein
MGNTSPDSEGNRHLRSFIGIRPWLESRERVRAYFHAPFERTFPTFGRDVPQLPLRCAMTVPKTKTCSGCRQRKPLTEYFRSCRFADGRNSRCKCCDKASRRRSYLKHRVRVLQKQRAYQCAYIATHQREHRQAAARWRKKNPEYYRSYYRRYRRKLLEYGRRYREAKKSRAAAD